MSMGRDASMNMLRNEQIKTGVTSGPPVRPLLAMTLDSVAHKEYRT